MCPSNGWRRGAMAAAILVWSVPRPAAAQVISEIGAEFTSWQTVFDADFVPIAITAGLLLALIAAMFSRVAGVVVFVFTVAGAAAYGARDGIVALAGGG
ncbi:MAG TPA: hypothetical protein VFO41_09630 [Alphaproteobacteria bacterium]|nr:hypothetical protein [Alphaproteobacteria bacterium]